MILEHLISLLMIVLSIKAKVFAQNLKCLNDDLILLNTLYVLHKYTQGSFLSGNCSNHINLVPSMPFHDVSLIFMGLKQFCL